MYFAEMRNKLLNKITLRKTAMIKCHLSTLMGRDKLKIADVARITGLNRSAVTAMYKEQVKRVELEAMNQLCELFKCDVSDLFEYIEDKKAST